MNKIILSLAALLFASNCAIIDNLGLNVVTPTIKGSEAKSLILTRAVAGAAVTGSGMAIATSLVTYNVKKLRDDKYYDKDDVDKCAENIFLFNYASASASNIAAGQLLCSSIREHKMLIDWPIPLL